MHYPNPVHHCVCCSSPSVAGENRQRVKSQSSKGKNVNTKKAKQSKQNEKHQSEKEEQKTEEKKLKDKFRKQRKRKQMTDEEREHYNSKAKLRMRKYRTQQQNRPKPQRSPAEIEKIRKKWRNQKRKERKAATPEMKEFKSKQALINKLRALRPRDFAELICSASTPKKKREMRRSMGQSPASPRTRSNQQIAFLVKQNVLKFKQKKDAVSRSKLKVLTSCFLAGATKSTKIREELQMKWQTWTKYSQISDETTFLELACRKKRCDAIKSSTINRVVQHYKDCSNASPLKRMSGKSILTDTTRRVHTSFTETYPKENISITTFRRMRPPEILTVDHNTFIGCVCEYCLNIHYKV